MHDAQVNLKPSRMYRVLLVAVTVVFAYMAWELAAAYAHRQSWLFAGLGLGCAAFAILSALQVPNRSHMVITDDAFSLRTIFGAQTYRWADVTHFRLGPRARMFETISFDFAKGHESRLLSFVLTAITRVLARADRNFPNGTDMDTRRLIHLLNQHLHVKQRA